MNTDCPKCNNPSITKEKWWDKYDKSDGLFYYNCQSCKVKLGSTLTMMGEVKPIIWEKSKEEK